MLGASCELITQTYLHIACESRAHFLNIPQCWVWVRISLLKHTSMLGASRELITQTYLNVGWESWAHYSNVPQCWVPLAAQPGGCPRETSWPAAGYTWRHKKQWPYYYSYEPHDAMTPDTIRTYCKIYQARTRGEGGWGGRTTPRPPLHLTTACHLHIVFTSTNLDFYILECKNWHHIQSNL